jgi:hypothetical protein
MSRIILRTKHNGVFTGTLKSQSKSGSRPGVTLELDANTGLLLWCPLNQVQEIITLPIECENDFKENKDD